MTNQAEQKVFTTSELFNKHFGDNCVVNLNNKNIEKFFEELNIICINENKQNDKRSRTKGK